MRVDTTQFIVDLRMENNKTVSKEDRKKIDAEPKKETLIEVEVRERLKAIQQIYPLEERAKALQTLIDKLNPLERTPEKGKTSRVDVVRNLAIAMLQGIPKGLKEKGQKI